LLRSFAASRRCVVVWLFCVPPSPTPFVCLHVCHVLLLNGCSCGVRHKNPKLCDTYRVCHHCTMVLRDPHEAKTPAYAKEDVRAVLKVVAAAYGHESDASLAVDIGYELQQLILNNTPSGVKATFCMDTDMRKLFGDPCPGVKKAIRFRYEMPLGMFGQRRGEIFIKEREDGFLSQVLHVESKKEPPRLIIQKAIYGHPRGPTNGRGAFDVTEQIQVGSSRPSSMPAQPTLIPSPQPRTHNLRPLIHSLPASNAQPPASDPQPPTSNLQTTASVPNDKRRTSDFHLPTSHLPSSNRRLQLQTTTF
jgi:hypothetical protein